MVTKVNMLKWEAENDESTYIFPNFNVCNGINGL